MDPFTSKYFKDLGKLGTGKEEKEEKEEEEEEEQEEEEEKREEREESKEERMYRKAARLLETERTGGQKTRFMEDLKSSLDYSGENI